ncbi:MAG: hypothetical protein HQK49_17450 [Oligoflexia bacterium]|nr:hypothetical protein [Oligoflexia bacterium]
MKLLIILFLLLLYTVVLIGCVPSSDTLKYESNSISNDTTAPTLSITATGRNPCNFSNFTLTFTFSEAVTDFTIDDIVANNCDVSNFKSISSKIYTADIAILSEGAVKVEVPSQTAQDSAGNKTSNTATYTTVYDTTSPTVSISSSSTTVGSATNSAININIIFSEAVSGFTSSRLTVINGTVTSFTSGTSGTSGSSGSSGSTTKGTNYSATITPIFDGVVSVMIAAGSVSDEALNLNKASESLSWTYDKTSPTATITSSISNTITNISPIPITITFSEDVFNFTIDDITVANGTLSNFVATSATTYTADITPSAEGAVTVSVGAAKANDAALNSNSATSTFTRTYDTISPSVIISSDSTTTITKTNPIPITITFSENVSGVDVADFTISNGTISNIIASNASSDGSSSIYTAEITATANGLLTVIMNAAGATDSAGNGNQISNTFSRTYDTVSPSVIVSSSTSDEYTKTSPISVTFTFSESVYNFILQDITVTNGSATNFSSSSLTTYTADIVPSAEGVVSVSVGAASANDAAENSNTLSNTLNRTYDITAPSVTLSSSASNPTHISPIALTLNFSEAILNFAITDINVTNASISNLQSLGGNQYSADIYPSPNVTVNISVAAATFQDRALNDNLAATPISRTYYHYASAVLDSDFNNPKGYYTHDNAAGGNLHDRGNAIARRGSDGKIIIAGQSWNGSNFDMTVWRLYSNGSLDTTFASNGIYKHNGAAGGNGDDIAYAVALDSDQKIVVAGKSINASGNSDMLVWRLTADGNLDTATFGSGNGFFKHDNAATGSGDDIAYAVAIDSNSGNKILVAGTSLKSPGNSDMVIWRINSDGSGLDSTFNPNTGYFVSDNAAGGNGNDEAKAIAIQSSDQKIVVAGSSLGSGTNDIDMAIWRFTSGGILDTTFSDDGIFTHNNAALGDSDDHAYSVAIDSNNKIVVAGDSTNAALNLDMAVWRLSSTGVLDNTFNSSGGGNGIFTHNSAAAGNSNDGASEVKIQSDGKIVIFGYSTAAASNIDMAIWRLGADGTLDVSSKSAKSANDNPFNTTVGYFTHNSAAGGNGEDRANTGIIIEESGSFLVVGFSNNNSANEDMCVWKIK